MKIKINRTQDAQKWLEKHSKNKDKITELEIYCDDISWKKFFKQNIDLKGNLRIENFSELKTVYLCGNRKDLKISIIKCPKLTTINSANRNLTSLKLHDLLGLTRLSCKKSKLKDLNIVDCPNITKLYCGENELESLDLTGLTTNDLTKLEELEFNNNLIKNLDYSLLDPDKLTWLNASDNDFSKQDLNCFSNFINLELLWIGNEDESKIEEDIQNRFYGSLRSLKNLKKLKSLNISNTDIDSGLEYLPECLLNDVLSDIYKSNKKSEVNCKSLVINLQKKLKNAEELIRKYSRNRNIILIGCTGSGKSALGNVLVSKNNRFEEVFEEGDLGTSKTKDTEIKEFEDKDRRIEYSIVDTIGIDDTSLHPEVVKERITEAIRSVKYGLSQVLFVVRDKFTEEKKKTYDLLVNVIFDESIAKYVTIVRTNFPSFEDEIKCKEDQQSLLKENPWLEKIVESVNRLIHVDNPPPTGHYSEISEKSRRSSREKLLKHLADCEEIYYPQEQKSLRKIRQNIEEQLEELKRKSLEVDQDNEKELNWKILVLQGLKEEIEEQIEEEISAKVNDFLEVKKVFLDIRKKTIEELIKCYNEIIDSAIMYAGVEATSKAMESIGEINATLKIPKAIGGTANAVNNFLKEKNTNEHIKSFQKLLEDEKEKLLQFRETLDSLYAFFLQNQELKANLKILEALNLEGKLVNKEIKLFNTKYEIFDVLKDAEILEGMSLNSSDQLVRAMVALSKNLDELKLELEQEEKQINKFNDTGKTQQISKIIYKPLPFGEKS